MFSMLFRKKRDDNINSRIFSMHIHMDESKERLVSERLKNLTYPVTMYLPYLDVSILGIAL